MLPLRAVFQKEVFDNFRDRRTLMSTLILGPVFGPILFAFIINLSIKQSLSDVTVALDVPVIGQEYAPNLVEFLGSRNINVVDAPDTRAAALVAVKRGQHELVIVIPDNFGENLRSMVPATVELVSDQADSQAERDARRVRRALGEYNQRLASLRLTARGVSAGIMRPLNIDLVDVSTPSGRSAMLLGMLSYFFLFALLTGGMNLAIDATAGERERGSLEPLLSLPVKRDQLIFGKILATCVFMAMSLALSLTSFYVMLQFVSLEDLGMAPNFGPREVLVAFFFLLPFTLVGAALMTLVASFTKSYKEAQTWVSIVLLAPTLPILVVSILMVRATTALMLIPALSQHLLVVGLIKNEPLVLLDIVVSVVSTLLAGVLLTLVSARLYRREGLLV
jgi:sodium transport system permease protein